MRVIVRPSNIIPREVERKQRREYTEAHHESLSIPSENSLSSHVRIGLTLHPLALGPPWYVGACALLPGVLVVFSCVYGNHTLRRDSALADRTNHGLSRLVHPSVDAGPAVQMATPRHNWLLRSLKANVALKHRILTVLAWLLLLLLGLFDRLLFWLFAFLKIRRYFLTHSG